MCRLPAASQLLLLLVIPACLNLQLSQAQTSASTVINGLQCPDNVVTLDSVADPNQADITSALLAGDNVTLFLEPGTYLVYDVFLSGGRYCIIGNAARADVVLTSSSPTSSATTTTFSVSGPAEVGLKSLTWTGSVPGRPPAFGPDVFGDGALLTAEDVNLRGFASPFFGGALFVDSGATARLSIVTFKDNVASDVVGGAVACASNIIFDLPATIEFDQVTQHLTICCHSCLHAWR
jgi:hypothetical protein